MKKRISETNNGLLKVEIPVISLPAVGASFAEVLSRGEREFIELLTEGHSYEQIAKSMNVSINTVRDYVRSSYKKLKVNSRTQAVVKYLQAGPIRTGFTNSAMLADQQINQDKKSVLQMTELV